MGAAQTAQVRWSHTEAERLWDDHGAAAYTLACALLGDEAAAGRAVALGMTDFVGSRVDSSGADTRRSVARHVYWRCTDLASQAPGTTGLSPTMAWIARLPRAERGCLALCVFGGLTYREAADLLDVPPLTVARMLASVLTDLGARPLPAKAP